LVFRKKLHRTEINDIQYIFLIFHNKRLFVNFGNFKKPTLYLSKLYNTDRASRPLQFFMSARRVYTSVTHERFAHFSLFVRKFHFFSQSYLSSYFLNNKFICIWSTCWTLAFSQNRTYIRKNPLRSLTTDAFLSMRPCVCVSGAGYVPL